MHRYCSQGHNTLLAFRGQMGLKRHDGSLGSIAFDEWIMNASRLRHSSSYRTRNCIQYIKERAIVRTCMIKRSEGNGIQMMTRVVLMPEARNFCPSLAGKVKGSLFDDGSTIYEILVPRDPTNFVEKISHVGCYVP